MDDQNLDKPNPDLTISSEIENEPKKEEATEKSTITVKNRSLTPWIITLVCLVLVIIAGILYTKFQIIDQKDSQISTLEAEKNLQKSVISNLGVNLEEYTKNLAEANTELENTTAQLKNADSMLNFLLDESADALVEKYISGYSEAIDTYNFFTQGIDNSDFRFYITYLRTEKDYGGWNEEQNTYSYTMKYSDANKKYKELFGSSNNLPTKAPTVILVNYATKIEYDDSLYESIGGFRITYDNQKEYQQKNTFIYKTKEYYVVEDGFSIDLYVAFATPRNDGSYGYYIKLTDGTNAKWGGYSCMTTGTDFIDDNKNQLPIYTMNFSQDDGNYILKSINIKS